MTIGLLIAIILGLVLFIAYKLLWNAVKPQVQQKVSVIGLTENEKAANGPIPGDVSLYIREWENCQKLHMPGYLKGLNTAEIADGERSGVFPCATSTVHLTNPTVCLHGEVRMITSHAPISTIVSRVNCTL